MAENGNDSLAEHNHQLLHLLIQMSRAIAQYLVEGAEATGDPAKETKRQNKLKRIKNLLTTATKDACGMPGCTGVPDRFAMNPLDKADNDAI